MGAGASASLSAALGAGSPEELEAALQAAPLDERTKIAAVVKMMGQVGKTLNNHDAAGATFSSAARNTLGMTMLGFGTYQMSPDEAEDAVCEALKAGFRHIECSSGCNNEEGVGRGIIKSGVCRDEIFITSKVYPGYAAAGEAEKTFTDICKACTTTLKKMQLHHLDLYLIQGPLASTRLEQWTALLHLRFWGKIRKCGVSNYLEKHIKEIEEAGLELPAANEIEYHPMCQQSRLIPFLKSKGIVPIGYASLAPLSTWRAAEGQGGDACPNAMKKHAQEVISEMAQRHGVREAKLLLCWAVQKGVAVLSRSCNPVHIQENYHMFGLFIPPEDMEKLTALDRDKGIAWMASGINPVAVEVALGNKITFEDLHHLIAVPFYVPKSPRKFVA